MTIGREQVLHVARLAELAVRDDELPALVEQMGRIVDYVAQLREAPVPEGVAGEYVAGPDRVALREDEVAPVPLARPPAALAPAFVDGFFVVPKLGAMEEA
ncbi:MAG TPA: Asp-tRNA(Asn)/Glu-tRNA(Gln) amidotransferase subunit GatC [Gemmatimonadales bacterium]|nr:Asp-tRNA(Asn)/Glu-tRNA(Gln) amidotransferase subunit GatC [Gemmatimonadales bacterium]